MEPADQTASPTATEQPIPIATWAALLLLYPVGLWMLLRAPRPSGKVKFATAIAFGLVFLGGLFVLNVAFLGARLSFDGNVWPRLDFFHTRRHYRALAEHRAAQKSESLPAPALSASSESTFDWPSFRGRERDGIVRDESLALPWPEGGPALLWRQPVGQGFSSFAVQGGRAYTLEQRSENEAVACYALDDGRELWTHTYPALFEEAVGGPGPRSTPTLADGSVYTLGATGVLNCLDAMTGELVWTRNILNDASAENLPWAMAGSPLVHEERVIVNPGGQNASVIAYDVASSEIVWKSGSAKAGYSSPTVATLGGVEQILVFDAAGLSSYQPDYGTLLWQYPWVTDYDVNAAQPLPLDDEWVFLSSNYGHGCTLVRVSQNDGAWQAEKVWETKSLQLKFSSAVLYEGSIYGLDNNILVCLDPETGKRHWKAGRYGFGQFILADGYLILQCENGDLALVEASPEEHREISRVDALTAKTWNHPAVADGRLLLRNDREMMCFDLTPQ